MILTGMSEFSEASELFEFLPYHFQNLNDFLKSLKKTLVTGITESWIKVNSQPLINIDLNNYNIQSTPTESEKGGTLLYISSDLNYKVGNDLKIYKAKELELVVIEIINKDKKKYILGCIYIYIYIYIYNIYIYINSWI